MPCLLGLHNEVKKCGVEINPGLQEGYIPSLNWSCFTHTHTHTHIYIYMYILLIVAVFDRLVPLAGL